MLVGATNEPVWTMRPSGSTNMNGYDGMKLRADGMSAHVFVDGE